MLALGAALLASGCAGPESQLSSALASAGLPPSVSTCMARRMVDQLSIGQLLKLRSLGGLADRPVADLSAREFLRRVRALKDPEILAVTGSALARCGLGV
ncbi:hypothetical protein GVO57_02520 [Sphingomonas changnyeongensis]|uniref:Uncharacterized protein n=2 Tax=Sphingomonas changnyeongensis TaxID=2698679 RepID=A0A7Z2NXP7_9SPHN|nr:hypothetical protein GVO57_02520 [Sphingomonas changnyeongensis]